MAFLTWLYFSSCFGPLKPFGVAGPMQDGSDRSRKPAQIQEALFAHLGPEALPLGILVFQDTFIRRAVALNKVGRDLFGTANANDFDFAGFLLDLFSLKLLNFRQRVQKSKFVFVFFFLSEIIITISRSSMHLIGIRHCCCCCQSYYYFTSSSSLSYLLVNCYHHQLLASSCCCCSNSSVCQPFCYVY